MDPGEVATPAKTVEVLADGLGGDLEPSCQIVDRHAPERARELDDFGLPPGNGHRSENYPQVAILETVNLGKPAAGEWGVCSRPPRRHHRNVDRGAQFGADFQDFVDVVAEELVERRAVLHRVV